MRNPRHSGGPDSLTIVIKLGTSSIVSEANWLPQLALLSAITETICSLRRLGHRVVLVSSGAIAMGLKRMELTKRPKALSEKQVRENRFETDSWYLYSLPPIGPTDEALCCFAHARPSLP